MKYSNETYKAVRLLFMAYPQAAKNEDTMNVYATMLADVPVGLLNKTIKKCICEQKFLPSIAEIRQAAQSLMGAVDPSRRVKTWTEAQAEILRGISRTWYHGCLGEIPDDDPRFGQSCDPMWSTPEIKAAVDSFGFETLCQSPVDDMSTVLAQLRRLYEQACQRKEETAVNSYVLGDDAERLQQLVGGIGLLKEG
jgi:hypothetical protein